jgi:glycosyltransferase involved in cell wall biosynthesis
MNKKTALLFCAFRSSFLQKDRDILDTEFQILEHDFDAKNKAGTPLKFVSQKLFLLRNIAKADIIMCQFAGYHSLLPALFGKISRKPCLIIVGGTDAHDFPGIGYGNWQKRFLKTFTALSFRLCTHIAPKHRALMNFDYSYDPGEPPKQGIYAHLPSLKTPFTEIPNGYDAEKWKCLSAKRKNTFITIGTSWEYPFQRQLKGVDLITNVASYFPDCEFVILGATEALLPANHASNLKILPPKKHEELAKVLSEYEFYMQLSIAEGFPNSLSEAMLCECVPIGSNVFGIPEIIGNTGFILKHRDTEELKKLIEKALASDATRLGKQARSRIAENYTYVKRSEKLLNLCNRLIEKKPA